MSSRTTRAKAQLNAVATAVQSRSTPTKPQLVKGPQVVVVDGVAEDQEKMEQKENVKQEVVAARKSTAKPTPTRKASLKGKAKEDVFCLCKMGDNGTPMIYCVECTDWYHFSCVGLDERTADDINLYVCPACSDRTGLRVVMEWEGPNGIEEVIQTNCKPITKTIRKKSQPQTNSVLHLDESQESDDPGSEDDYTEEVVQAKPTGKRRLRQTYESESDSDSVTSEAHRKRRLTKGRPKGSHSPGPSAKAKRKTSMTVTQQPPAKKARTTSSADPTEDPTRKYCLGKLEELFQGIFLRYPHIRTTGSNDEADGAVALEAIIEKKPEELTEDERATVLANAKQFADELESCVYEIYCELDKSGISSAGGKYKDRFRTIQFNLSKPDRVVIHKRIATNQISPKEISLMSSTDLANEELKQSIKIAEQEALEHSILKKTTAPRAKITHKGLEDIEDINGNTQDRERRQEDEERMERERLARLRTAQPRQRTMSVSVPPESPVVPQSGDPWGAPPPVPPHAFSPIDIVSPGDFNPQRPSLLINSESDMVIQEPELNLADLINIDDEPRFEDASDPPQSSAVSSKLLAGRDEGAIESPVPAPHPPTPLSPFANVPQPANPTTTTDTPDRFFNLDSLWSVPARDAPMSPVEQNSNTPSSQEDVTDIVMGPLDPLGGGSANDGDFDMFLEEKEPPTSEVSRQLFEGLPIVWDGKISMPLDSTIPQETPVLARQMGGRPIEAESLLWKTLFPSDLLRIDGRVPIENSAKFLLQMRMNPTKELIAVAFSPVTEGESGFKALSDFLIAKGRHGLVFPWGQRPKEHHPGKEMYIIPLLSSHPLPDYIELLDDLKLPKERTSNYIIGIWWLTRGKLTPPSLPAVAPTPNIPLVISSQPTPPTPQLQPTPTPILTLPSQIASLAATLPVDQKALAAEIASLTPEQMDLMMRALSSVPGAVPTPPVPVPTPSQSQSAPSVPGFSTSNSQPPWSPSATNYPSIPPYPSTSVPGHSSPPQQNPQHNDPGRGGGGGRRSGGGGGRGNRGRHRSDDFSRRPVDSGWSRKRQMQADSSHNGGWS